jgi:hypothetical protein
VIEREIVEAADRYARANANYQLTRRGFPDNRVPTTAVEVAAQRDEFKARLLRLRDEHKRAEYRHAVWSLINAAIWCQIGAIGFHTGSWAIVLVMAGVLSLGAVAMVVTHWRTGT